MKFLRCWIYFISQKLSEISFKKFGAKGQYVLVLMAKKKEVRYFAIDEKLRKQFER